MAFLSLPVFWTLFLGQLDFLALLGVVGLPFLAPLVLLKPQVAAWSLAAKRSYAIAFLVVLGASLVVWGLWPVEMYSLRPLSATGKHDNDISLGPAGWPLALILLWLSRGDVDMLMLAGSLGAPYLMPYNVLAAVPAVSRLRPKAAALACCLSWLPLSANWLGPVGWWLGWAFVIWVWVCLAKARYRSALEPQAQRLRERLRAAIDRGAPPPDHTVPN
jgi:hypothetical protein